MSALLMLADVAEMEAFGDIDNNNDNNNNVNYALALVRRLARSAACVTSRQQSRTHTTHNLPIPLSHALMPPMQVPVSTPTSAAKTTAAHNNALVCVTASPKHLKTHQVCVNMCAAVTLAFSCLEN
jgi:hypothetical protein